MGIENIDVKLPSDAASELVTMNSDADIAEVPSNPETAEILKEHVPKNLDQEDAISIDETSVCETAAIETPVAEATEILTTSEDEGEDSDKTAEAPLDGVPLEEEIIEEEERRKRCDQADITPIGLTEEQLNAILQNANKSILEQVGALGTQLSDISARVSSLRKLADMHEGIENDLNNQLNAFKENFYRRIVNPILMEIFDVQEYMNSDIPSATEETSKVLIEYVDMFTKTLQHYGVTVEKVNVGDVYDVKKHKPIRAVPTQDITLDKTIAHTRKTLIHYIDGQLVERAPVQVYQFTEPTDSKNDTVQ